MATAMFAFPQDERVMMTSSDVGEIQTFNQHILNAGRRMWSDFSLF